MYAATWQFEDSALDQVITALCIAPVQFGIGAGWVVLQAVKAITAIAVWLFAAIAENAGLIAKLVGIVTVTLFLVTQPQITIAMALIAAFGWMTWR